GVSAGERARRRARTTVRKGRALGTDPGTCPEGTCPRATPGGSMNAVVCLPTYNERENLEAMVLALRPHGVRILVVDDRSPDGTGELADRLAAEHDFVDVLHRERKEGLGPAYLAAFRHALAAGAELILEMD